MFLFFLIYSFSIKPVSICLYICKHFLSVSLYTCPRPEANGLGTRSCSQNTLGVEMVYDSWDDNEVVFFKKNWSAIWHRIYLQQTLSQYASVIILFLNFNTGTGSYFGSLWWVEISPYIISNIAFSLKLQSWNRKKDGLHIARAKINAWCCPLKSCSPE